MTRLRRFPDNRFIGRRDTMIVYDCDDPEQFAVLDRDVQQGRDMALLIQSFAPDILAEAINRGFTAFKGMAPLS